MGASINLSGLKIKGNAQMLNDVKIIGHENTKIKVENTEVEGDVKLLERLEIGPVIDELQKELRSMDPSSAEYCSLQKIVKMKDTTPQGIIAALKRHLGTFSQGVLSNVVATCISKHLP